MMFTWVSDLIVSEVFISVSVSRELIDDGLC